MDSQRDLEKVDVSKTDVLSAKHHQHIDSRLAVDEPATAGFSDLTLKTWIAISLLSSSVGISFWPVPTTSPMLATLGAQFNDSASSAWFLSSFTTGCALGFLISGTNSDLFGRRVIVLTGNLLSAIGAIVCATSHRSDQFIAGMSILGFASGMSQLGLIGVPELMPNKYRVCVQPFKY
jgi:MFS family permease